ncbi:hypothetical protein BDA99DRAFT_544265 [Phascolomyces articulosus]|uniref:Uncharacterized protein n=1 Tax=Phascolomyces articulosus TaxID=60185 RepID=A0AAD5JX51_9FUNG|nr:hypothetical protein BDA99DRAFT_544265 [Phascolomyces articulosus]
MARYLLKALYHNTLYHNNKQVGKYFELTYDVESRNFCDFSHNKCKTNIISQKLYDNFETTIFIHTPFYIRELAIRRDIGRKNTVPGKRLLITFYELILQLIILKKLHKTYLNTTEKAFNINSSSERRSIFVNNPIEDWSCENYVKHHPKATPKAILGNLRQGLEWQFILTWDKKNKEVSIDDVKNWLVSSNSTNFNAQFTFSGNDVAGNSNTKITQTYTSSASSSHDKGKTTKRVHVDNIDNQGVADNNDNRPVSNDQGDQVDNTSEVGEDEGLMTDSKTRDIFNAVKGTTTANISEHLDMEEIIPNTTLFSSYITSTSRNIFIERRLSSVKISLQRLVIRTRNVRNVNKYGCEKGATIVDWTHQLVSILDILFRDADLGIRMYAIKYRLGRIMMGSKNYLYIQHHKIKILGGRCHEINVQICEI